MDVIKTMEKRLENIIDSGKSQLSVIGPRIFYDYGLDDDYSPVKIAATFDTENRILYDGFVHLEQGLRGHGYGTQIYNNLLKVCMGIGIDTILVNANGNYQFWNHLGFREIQPDMLDDPRFSDVVFEFAEDGYDPPMYKNI